MRLTLERFDFTDTSTIGRLTVDGEFFCYTLEDADRNLECGGDKIYGKTAIPRGTYKVIIDWSNRFKREMPHILDVPGFEGIRVHSGNMAEDTEGCILVGSRYTKDYLYNSKATFDTLFARLDAALESGDVVLEVK